MPIVQIKALKNIVRDGLPLVHEGNTAQVEQWLADECVASGEAELVTSNRKPVDLATFLAPKEKKEK